MKIRIPALILLLLLLSEVADAQILLGPVAGANYSWVSFGDKDLKREYKVKGVYGYHFGAHLSFRVRKRFFLHSSLLYSTKGREMEGKTIFTKSDMTYRYIDLPIVYTAYFKANIGKEPVKFSIGIGPNISYWLSGKGTFENVDTHEFNNGGTAIVPIKVAFKEDRVNVSENEMGIAKPTRLQLGLNFTAGLLFEPARDREMVLTFRYELGHSYLSKETDGTFRNGLTEYQEPLKVRNQGFRISLAYLIDLKVEQRKKGKSTNDPKKRRY